MILIDKISKQYGKIKALQNVSLKFEKKETTVIIGASGSGKSTLLRCINNIEYPTSGTITLDDELLTGKTRSKLCYKMGMVFQNFNLFKHMNVLQNLTYAPQNILGLNKIDAEEKARILLKTFKVLDKINEMPKNLSGGQKQRVAICRALMMEPETILFDEPTSALDPEVIKDIINIINGFKKNIRMIIITHHIKFAKVIADRIIFMDKGLVLADQPSEEFFIKPSSHRAKLFLDNVIDLI